MMAQSVAVDCVFTFYVWIDEFYARTATATIWVNASRKL